MGQGSPPEGRISTGTAKRGCCMWGTSMRRGDTRKVDCSQIVKGPGYGAEEFKPELGSGKLPLKVWGRRHTDKDVIQTGF